MLSKQMAIHACMNDHCSYMHDQPPAMINVDHADDVLIIAVDQVHLKILCVAVIKANDH